MIKETVTYEDYNGNTHTEELHFHLTRSEMVDMEIDADEPASVRIKKLEQTQDTKELYRLMKSFVQDSYGVKSEDGRHFKKSPAIHEDFKNSAAYDEFFFSLFRDTEKVIKFINGIMPAKAMEEALAEADKRKIKLNDTREAVNQTFGEYQESKKEESKADVGTFGQTLEGDVQAKKEDLTPDQMREKLREAGLL